jgi:branched-chain amino acid transport system substrate-binding protein
MMKFSSGLTKALHTAGIVAGLLAISMHACFAQPVVVGQIGPFTGLPSPDAIEVNAGAQAYFDKVNAEGGLKSRKIEFFKLDDKFNPDEFAKQLLVAADKKPVALISPIGSATILKSLKEGLFDKVNLVIVNAIPGSEAVRSAGYKHMFHVRAGDAKQIEKILRHASSTGLNKIHVLHQDLPIGISGLAVAKSLAPKFNVEIVGQQAKADEPSLKEAAKLVFGATPQAILVVGTPKFAADAVTQTRKAGFKSSIFTLSYMPAGLLTKLAGEADARGVGISQTFPNPNGKHIPLQKQFQETMMQYSPDTKVYTSFHLEGYLSARTLVNALKLTNGNPTTEQLSQAMRSMGQQDFGGYTVDFSKSNSGSDFVDIGVVTVGGKLMY